MKYVFFGTPDFAAIILEKLCAGGFPPVAVVTNPDRPFGRKKVIPPPPAKRVAREYGIPVLQPETITSDFLKELRGIAADLFIVAAYAKILPADIISLPPRGVLGVHPSLLPKLRGTTPIQTAILNGDENAGTTIFLLDEKVDHGHILAQASVPIERKNYEALARALAELSADLLIGALPKWERGECTPVPQDETQATFTKKFSAEDGHIPMEELERARRNDHSLAERIERTIRALNPEPGVYTLKDGKRIKLLEAEIGGNSLHVRKIQREGEKPTGRVDL